MVHTPSEITKFLYLAFCVLSILSAVIFEAEAFDSDEREYSETIIGIDLGTTYSCVGVFKNGHVQIIPNDHGNRITPSYVAFTAEGEILVGDAAMNQISSNPENTVFDVKRLIGRSWNDTNVQHDRKYWPFKVGEKSNKPHVAVRVLGNATLFAPEEISAMILSKMREIAESYLGKKVSHAVITVPAYFTDAQRQATKDAGTIAGLNVTRILNEPSAAAMAYSHSQKEVEKTILVFDLGGGTFDVSILIVTDEGSFDVLATNGDSHLGGEDFNHRVIKYFIQLYKEKTGNDIRSDKRAIQKLRREVERAKRDLTSRLETRVEVDNFFNGEDLSETLTRAKFEQLNMDLFQSLFVPVKRVLKDAKLFKTDVDEIVLVGGSTRIPKVQQLVMEYFGGKDPRRGKNPDEDVAYGAAVQGGILLGDQGADKLLIVDAYPHSLGVKSENGNMTVIIPRNNPIPFMNFKNFTTARDNQTIVSIEIFEGESNMTKDNRLLGEFSLTGIEPAPKGVPIITVSLYIDIDGILKVSAGDVNTGSQNQIVISRDQNRLSPKDIEKMHNSTKAYRHKDKRIKKKLEALEELESYIYSLKHQITETGKLSGLLPDEDRTTIEAVLDKAIMWMELNPSAYELGLKKKSLVKFMQPFFNKARANVDGHHDEL